MATLLTLAAGLNHAPFTGVPTPVSNTPVTASHKFDLATDGSTPGVALNDNDVIEMVWLPALCVLVPGLVYLASGELDDHATPTMVLNLGVSVGGTLDEDAIIDGFTVGATWQIQNGPNNALVATGAFESIGYSDSARAVSITVEGNPADDTVTGVIELTIGYRMKRAGDTNTD